MELSLLMKVRIGAAICVGIVFIGLLGWPLAPDSDGAVMVGVMSTGDIAGLAVLAFVTGVAGYFVAWPYGRQIGIIAVPSGLGVWAIRSGSIGGLIQQSPALSARQELFSGFMWEPLFWLAIVAVGFAGVLAATKIRKAAAAEGEVGEKGKWGAKDILSGVIALAGSVLIARFMIEILAQNVRVHDSRVGSVMAQPATAQIVFAVLVSFALAAFVVKKVLSAGYVWTAVASGLVTAFVGIAYVNEETVVHVAAHWPAVFFSHAVSSILPVQMVAFGVLGAVAGYWLAVRYRYWRAHS